MENKVCECPSCANTGEHKFHSMPKENPRYTCLNCGHFWTEGVKGKDEFTPIEYCAFYLSSRIGKNRTFRVIIPIDNTFNKAKVNVVVKRVERLIENRTTLPIQLRHFLRDRDLTLKSFQSILDTIKTNKQSLILRALLEDKSNESIC